MTVKARRQFEFSEGGQSAWKDEEGGYTVARVVWSADDDDEAVALANDSNYGLASYVYSGDNARALCIARQIQSGSVALNSIVLHTDAPFGGFKLSGIGRDRGAAGLEAYSEVQAISWVS